MRLRQLDTWWDETFERLIYLRPSAAGAFNQKLPKLTRRLGPEPPTENFEDREAREDFSGNCLEFIVDLW